MELTFRVVIVPPVMYLDNSKSSEFDSLLMRFRQKIQSCGMTIAQIYFSKVKKSDNEEYPEIEELIIQVQGKIHCVTLNGIKSNLYREFLCNWKSLFDISLPCSYIVLYENECFERTKKHSHQDVKYHSFSFGVLPHNGQFLELEEFIGSSQDCINFFHDTKNVVIHYNKFELILSYENIRTIFVNIESAPYQIFFDLFHPPTIFRVCCKRARNGVNYNLKERSITFDERSTFETDVLGRANVLCLSLINPNLAEKIISSIHYCSSEQAVHYSCFLVVRKSKPLDPVIEFNHFGCTYLLIAMFKRNFVMLYQALNCNYNILSLKKMCIDNSECLEKALTIVLSAIDSGKIINYWYAIEEQYHFFASQTDGINYNNYLLPESCRMIRRITLTPTRQLLWCPDIMYGNRVLRNFDSEHAVRVSFRDDNLSRLSFNASSTDADIFFAAIAEPMLVGIRIGSQLFEFLAWSNSQIRDHGVWMYSVDSKGKTAQDIRSWMGNFSHIHSVPKYMARMGQCFSQTEDAVSVPLEEKYVKVEDDVEGGFDLTNGKSYCFSDGVGKMSLNLAQKVHAALGHDKLCSAFQIRYGGFKGMLVIDPNLRDADIIFRKSMMKFDSPKNIQLEIAKCSAPGSAQLNRPFISLLNDLGVRHRTFLKLQEEMLKTLTDMLFDEEKAAAFLKSKTPSSIFKYKDISRSGIYLTTEPFFRSLLLALHRHHIERIKTRANIDIDPSQGRNLLGVMDETGILKYGEVFIQYTEDISSGETTRKTIVLKGEVLVTKNPCLLPGDVRKFQAVDIPQLHHIKDCIVFPQKGPRPHPNEMAGSDLDGDEYLALWNKDLIFYSANRDPGHFPAVSSPMVDNIKLTDMIGFLVEYIRNDQVGVIANAHLAHADKRGILSPECISIAKKFSVAVDFAKNGKSVHLDRSERPDSYPDFMEKNHKEAYKSEKALGKMYRVCKDFESENENASLIYDNIQVDKDLIYPGWEKYKDSALKSKNKYCILLRSVLRNYGIQHEAEAFSGAFTNLHCRFQERKDRAEIEKVVIGCIKKLSKSMLDEFLEEFKKSGDIKETDTHILQKASAWYVVTYSDVDAKYLSFPWVVSEYLSTIKVRKTGANPPCYSPLVMCMDEQIKICENRTFFPVCPESRFWNDYDFLCDPFIVRRALCVLILWAQDEEIVETPGHNRPGLLYMDTFIRLFLHIAELANYMKKKEKSTPVASKGNFSSASLCLEFLRFCITLRFYNKTEIRTVLPFTVFKYSRLSKKAVVSYHTFALSGFFKHLYFDTVIKKEFVRMKKPVYIDSSIFKRTPIDNTSIQQAQDALMKYSGVEEITLREITQTKKVCVRAYGTEDSIKSLKNLLRKKNVLTSLFTTGELPQSY